MSKKIVSRRIVSALVVAAGAATVQADVRVLHASPDAPAVDVYANVMPGMGAPAIEDLAFPSATAYLPLPTGSYDFTVTAANDVNPVLSAPGVAIDQNVDVTLAAVNFLNDIEIVALQDDRTSQAGFARVRFVHFSPDVPTVDVALANGGAVLFDAVSFTENGGYISVAPGTYDLEVRLDADNSVALPLPGVSLTGGFVYSVFAVGSLQTQDVQALILVDAIPAPGAIAALGMGLAVMGRRRR